MKVVMHCGVNKVALTGEEAIEAVAEELGKQVYAQDLNSVLAVWRLVMGDREAEKVVIEGHEYVVARPECGMVAEFLEDHELDEEQDED